MNAPEQAELIGRTGCAHFWTLVTRTEVVARSASGLPQLGQAQRIGHVCLLCRAVRPDIAAKVPHG